MHAPGFLPDWPAWSIQTFSALGFGLIALQVYDSRRGTATCNEQALLASPGEMRRFKRFQRKYLAIYYIVMLADWLQGTNMYTLYQVCRTVYILIPMRYGRVTELTLAPSF
jgi:hypothetical protein